MKKIIVEKENEYQIQNSQEYWPKSSNDSIKMHFLLSDLGYHNTIFNDSNVMYFGTDIFGKPNFLKNEFEQLK